MDIQQIAEKILLFVLQKYPDLDWNCNFTDNDCKIIQCLSFSDNSLNIEHNIWAGLHGQLKYIAWQDDQIGNFKIWINPPIEDMSYRQDYIAFEDLAYYKHKLWSEEDWLLCKQYRKVMLDIYTFILDEIQN